MRFGTAKQDPRNAVTRQLLFNHFVLQHSKFKALLKSRDLTRILFLFDELPNEYGRCRNYFFFLGTNFIRGAVGALSFYMCGSANGTDVHADVLLDKDGTRERLFNVLDPTCVSSPPFFLFFLKIC